MDAQDLVRRLPEELAQPGNLAEALGLVEDNELRAVAAWIPDREDSEAWWSAVLAVRAGYHKRGYGEVLKRAVLERAQAAGVKVVASHVHRKNAPMLALNEKLGAVCRPEPGSDFILCAIPVNRVVGDT